MFTIFQWPLCRKGITRERLYLKGFTFLLPVDFEQLFLPLDILSEMRKSQSHIFIYTSRSIEQYLVSNSLWLLQDKKLIKLKTVLAFFVISFLLRVKLTLFFQIVPCRLNLPITPLLESFRPHRSVLMSFIVAASIFPVTGMLPNLWSLLIEALNATELGLNAPPTLSLSSSRYPNFNKNDAWGDISENNYLDKSWHLQKKLRSK